MAKFYEEANAVYEKCRDPNVFGNLSESIESSIDFRNNVSVAANNTLDRIRRKLSIRSSHTLDLMSKYLSDISKVKKYLAKVNEENVGEVTFLVGLEDTKFHFHQHFTSSFFVQKCFAQLFCANNFLTKENWRKSCL